MAQSRMKNVKINLLNSQAVLNNVNTSAANVKVDMYSHALSMVMKDGVIKNKILKSYLVDPQ